MNFDIKAIKAEKIPTMQSAVEEYTTNVEAEIEKIRNYEVNTGDGVYGSAQIERVDSYIEETCKEIGSIVRYFDAFKEALTTVGAAYEAQQAAVKVNDVETHKQADPEDLIKVNRME